MIISLEGINKAEVLAALYNASRPQGMGFVRYEAAQMTVEEASGLLKTQTYFDYLKGRVMKIDLTGDELNPRLYDRDNGAGTAQRVINALRAEDDEAIQAIHKSGKQEAAKVLRNRLDEGHKVEDRDGYTVVTLGLRDVAKKVSSAIDAALDE